MHFRHRHRRWPFRGAVRRRMFWRFYLTLMVSLFAMVLVGGFLWRTIAEAPFPPGYELDTRLVEALLPPPDGSRAATQAAVDRLAASLGARVTLSAPDGRRLAAAGFANAREMADLPPDSHMMRGRTFRTWRIDLADGRMLVARGLTHFRDEPPPGFIYLFAVAAAIGLAAYPLVGRITRRLETLRHAVEDWGGGKLETRVPETGRDEIAAVARSFNAAAARVEALVEAHRTLLAHASHELRSPLARLRMAVEMFQANPSVEVKRTIEQDIAELDSLVEEILLASRLDHAEATVEKTPVDLLALAAEEAARAGADLADPGANAHFEVLGAPRLLRRLIRNLLENARRHGAPPIEIALSLTPPDRSPLDICIRLTVSDHGPGVPPEERRRIFEPFYRPSGHSEAGGSWGLGLALVRRIAESHGGSASCTSNPGGGALFVVELPLQDRAPSGPAS